MPYITYEEYKSMGGTVEQSAFPLLLQRSQKKLDSWTQNRIVDITDDVKLSMVIIINTLERMQGDKVASFSNDGVSVTFEHEDEQKNLYRQIVEILPSELTYL